MLRILSNHITLPTAALALIEFSVLFLVLCLLPLLGIPGLIPKIPLLDLDTQLLSLAAVVNCLTMAAVGLYHRNSFFDVKRAFFRVALSLPIAIILVCVAIAGYANFQSIDVKPYYALTIIGVTTLYLEAGLVRSLTVEAIQLEVLKKRVEILGCGGQARKIRQLWKQSGLRNVVLVGFTRLGDEDIDPNIEPMYVHELLGKRGSLVSYARKNQVDEIVVAMHERRRPEGELGQGLPVWDLLECKIAGVRITPYEEFWERQSGRVDLEELRPSWFIFGEGFESGNVKNFVERSFDIVLASGILLLTLPVLLTAAALIKLTSPGPVFYRQERTGQNNRVFDILKFRSMRVDAENGGVPQWACEGDDRITPIGRFIRRARIDELPQLINVLKGEMRFIGPRPERPYFTKQFSSRIPYYDERHQIKPGITGWAQIGYNYGASEEDTRIKLSYDLYYLKNRNFMLDLIIVLQTVRVVLWGEGSR